MKLKERQKAQVVYHALECGIKSLIYLGKIHNPPEPKRFTEVSYPLHYTHTHAISMHHIAGEMDIEYREIRLNPEDVLSHLQQLGYSNVTHQQLHEFIRDLKKLIKYDLKKQKNRQTGNISFGSHGASSCMETTACSSAVDSHDGRRQPFAESNHLSYGRSSQSTATSVSSTYTSGSSSENSNEGSSQQENVPSKPAKKKPRPSFIRPRDLGPPEGPPRSDPVALYHYYQKFWQHFKQPGEDEHRELRWNIRERMLGPSQQSNHPSKASSRSSLKRL